ncbi:acyl-CoA dehydrogenase [Tumidithrix helvetica PCC 7403]|uniref:acyl-CoA dehydrogenase n=1 Tax=Tumidithrix helvetica TaxID=3457545 RepID=UPI003C94DAF7
MITLSLAVTVPILLVAFVLLGYMGASLWQWSVYGAIALLLLNAPVWILGIFGILALVFNLPFLRRHVATTPIMKAIRALKLLPSISATEQAAIESGTVWIEGEFFSGNPNFQRIHSEPYPTLDPEIQSFLDVKVEKACTMATDWEIHRRKDMPPALWDYLKQERFFGMTIPKSHGGLGFSSLAYSAVMMKLASRSFIHTATVGVTNSLGPAKLLLNYGTAAQKEYYLPRLAKGEEIPCFALTEPSAGSDAASITAKGVVFKAEDDNLYIRLNFRKRYITLGAIATLLGLAFKLYDPDNLLGKGEDVGITCALIPSNTAGVILGKRHDPMGVPFYNSPIEGANVIVPISQIIGGVEQAGHGWQMLVQTLAAGRGISFPATCTGVAKFVTRVTGAYAAVRRQFGLPIGRFEGVEEPLARIGGLTYLMEAARVYTCAAVDRGEKPAVAAAIAKYQFTELARKIVNDGMDTLGGAGICRGPRNLLANLYTAMPIPITVEGSNILTRTMMIFGQGAIRCHPYIYQEIDALQKQDAIALDLLLWNHLGFTVKNGFRSLLLSLSRGHLAHSSDSMGTAVGLPKEIARYYQKLTWASATFAFLTDCAFLLFGGSLKRHEKLTGRFADTLSWLYLGSATLRRFAAEGQKSEDLPFVNWAMQYSLAQIQLALEGILDNLPLPAMIRVPLLGWCRLNPIGSLPTDTLGSQIAKSLQTFGSDRDRLTFGIYIPTDPNEALGRLENAFSLSDRAEIVFQKLKLAMRSGQLLQIKLDSDLDQAIALALSANIISEAEANLLREAELARNDAIQVDAFSLDEYMQGTKVDNHEKHEKFDAPSAIVAKPLATANL